MMKATLSVVNTRQLVKSRTYNPLEFRAEEGKVKTPSHCSVYSFSVRMRRARCVGAGPTLAEFSLEGPTLADRFAREVLE